MCRGFVLTAAAMVSSPGLGALCHVSLPLSLILFPVISSAVLSLKPIRGQNNNNNNNKIFHYVCSQGQKNVLFKQTTSCSALVNFDLNLLTCYSNRPSASAEVLSEIVGVTKNV